MNHEELLDLVQKQAEIINNQGETIASHGETITDLTTRIETIEELIKSKPNLVFSPSDPVIFPVEIDLPSGKKAVIRKCMAKDIIQVGRITAGNHDLYTPAIISQTVTIDGERILMAESVLEEMEAFDYLKLSLFFNQLGFL